MYQAPDDWPALRQWARDFMCRRRLTAGQFLQDYCQLPDVDACYRPSYACYAQMLSDACRVPSQKPGTHGQRLRDVLAQMQRHEEQVPTVGTAADAVRCLWHECGDRFASDGVVHAEFWPQGQHLVLRVWENTDTVRLRERLSEAMGASPHRQWFTGVTVLFLSQTSFFA